MSGIEFAGNYTNHQPPAEIASGFELVEQGGAVPDSVGANGAFGVEKENTGVDWYPTASDASPFAGGKVIQVQPGENQIAEALASAEAGDELVLADGNYNEAKSLNLQIPVTVRAETPGGVNLTFERRNLFLLSSNGGLKLSGLNVSGAAAPDNVGNSFIASTTRGGSGNHVVEMSNMNFDSFLVNRAFSVVTAAKGTFFDRVEVSNSTFKNISGIPFKFDAETDDFGIYNVEYLIIKDSTFSNVRGSVASVYRGGRDESTFGPHAFISGSSFTNVGGADAPLARLHGAQNIKLVENKVDAANPVRFVITTGIPKVKTGGNVNMDGTPASFLITEDLRK